MATPNYAFAKRQKELAKKAKKEEKKQAKLRGGATEDDSALDAGDSNESATTAPAGNATDTVSSNGTTPANG